MLLPAQFFNDQPPPAALPGSPLFDRLVLERPLVLLVALWAANAAALNGLGRYLQKVDSRQQSRWSAPAEVDR